MEIRDAELDAEQQFWRLFPKYEGTTIWCRGKKDRDGNILVLCEYFQSGVDSAIAGDVTVTLYHATDSPRALYVTGREEGD